MEHKILVVGSGAREHAIVKSLNNSGHNKKIYCIGSNLNPGISDVCEKINIGDINDSSTVISYAIENDVDIAIIGPENPLESGISDDLWKCGIKVVGPKKSLAQIETSKSFAVGGKGVKVSGEHLHNMDEAIKYCKEIINKGGKFVIEEKFIGEEFSLMSFCDGRSLKHMPIVQDHKRAYVNDTGPNTGGMGTYTDSNHSLPFLTNDDVKGAMEINKSTIKALSEKFSEEYKGVLYGGFIATADGVKLIEYNARFGDPEAMNVLSLIETDFIDICVAITDGTLDEINVQFNRQATVCKYVVPEGYPNNPVKGQAIDISEVTDQDNLYYASVDLQNKKLIECGSRTIAIVGIANSIPLAEALAENNAKLIKGPLFHREDIGKDFLIQKRVNNMKLLR